MIEARGRESYLSITRDNGPDTVVKNESCEETDKRDRKDGNCEEGEEEDEMEVELACKQRESCQLDCDG